MICFFGGCWGLASTTILIRSSGDFYLFIIIIFLNFYLFIYFWLHWVLVAARGLSLVVSGGYSSLWCTGFSLQWPLLLQNMDSRHAGSAVVAHGLSCSAACGIFPDQGSNPCPLHWQAYSFFFFKRFIDWLIDWLIAILGLRFCARVFYSCGKQGPLFIAVCGPLTIAASPVAEHRLQTRRLSSCGSRA